MALTTLVLAASIALEMPAAAQSSGSPAPAGSLHGQVTDPSGAVVPNATVAIVESGVPTHSTTTNRSGSYEIGNLAPGKYTVTANAKGFAIFGQTDVNVAAGQVTQFNIALDINVKEEKVNVESEGPTLDVNPANNASAIVLRGQDLDALPDDPDELLADLQAMAGPSAGPNGGQLYVDGFTAGELPPKSSIREIRINSNPFSAEYDKLGYGRIEIFTKPGTDKYHGQFSVVGNSSGLNTRNPFLGDAAQQPYDSVIYQGNLGGPINKKSSFFFDTQRRNIDEIAVVNATVLNSAFLPIPFQESVSNPHTRTNIGTRFDYQVSTGNTLTARYQFYRDTQQNAGVGGLALPEAGYDTTSTEHTVQISDTQILGTKVVNETHFQYLRENTQQNPLSTAPAIDVFGEFMGGGSTLGTATDHQDHYELQNYTSISAGKHFVKFGARLRAIHDINVSNAGFNGTYTFPDLMTYANAQQGSAMGTPLQFSISGTASGTAASVPVTMVDAGIYVQDDWKLRPNLTLSGGLRFETQSDIHDHDDWAPRLGFAWGLGGGGKSAPKTVLRGGFGLFYDRFTETSILNAYRENGVIQQQAIVPEPTFYPAVPPVNTLPPTAQTIYQINPELHAPYIMQTAFSVERQVTKIANLTVTYLNARGVHQFLSLNVNAPPPGTPFSSGPLPFPKAGPIYQYVSDGVFRQNQLITSFNVRAGAKLSLFGYYSLNYANSDTAGVSSFPSDQYDLAADYGRASFAIRDRVFFGGTVGLPRGFRLSPFLIFNSGSPYNVSVGQDLNNDSIFNDRPAFGANPATSCPFPTTAACSHYVIPTSSSALIPVNYLTGPDHFT
ncbi:MAG: carboxypeptidase regulatory-like domain-containing protein, partial [Terriglobales bacterium]